MPYRVSFDTLLWLAVGFNVTLTAAFCLASATALG